MKLQVLMSVMNQRDHSIVNKSNIRSDAIIINQSNGFKREVFKNEYGTVQFITIEERGVGLSRNTALMRADADVVLFADDDIKYYDKYKEVVLESFVNNPKADIIMFNVKSTNPNRPSADHAKKMRIYKYNSLKYGTYRMAARLDSIRRKNISFSLLFGGGAKYSSGEDSLFIYTALSKGLKVFAVPVTIGAVSHEESTWFSGFNEKFFRDKAVLFSELSPKFRMLLCIRFALIKYNPKETEPSRTAALKIMLSELWSHA